MFMQRASCKNTASSNSRTQTVNLYAKGLGNLYLINRHFGASYVTTCLANSGGSVVKDPSANAETQETRDRSLGWEDPWSRKRQPTPVFLPGKFHGQKSLEGYSPWGLKRVRHDLVVKQQQQTCPLTLQSVRIQ